MKAADDTEATLPAAATLPTAARRPLRARLGANALWLLLGFCGVAWTLFLWHPWIDWFGRPR